MLSLRKLLPSNRWAGPPRVRDRSPDDPLWETRHIATYEALRELVELLHLKESDARYGSLRFYWGMGTEDFIQSVGDVARAAMAKLKEH